VLTTDGRQRRPLSTSRCRVGHVPCPAPRNLEQNELTASYPSRKSIGCWELHSARPVSTLLCFTRRSGQVTLIPSARKSILAPPWVLVTNTSDGSGQQFKRGFIRFEFAFVQARILQSGANFATLSNLAPHSTPAGSNGHILALVNSLECIGT
jgi:hypothetical protein